MIWHLAFDDLAFDIWHLAFDEGIKKRHKKALRGVKGIKWHKNA